MWFLDLYAETWLSVGHAKWSQLDLFRTVLCTELCKQELKYMDICKMGPFQLIEKQKN